MTDPGDRIRASFRGRLLKDEPMARHTSLRVGGAADFFAVPADRTDLLQLITALDELNLPREIIGGGYNLLVRDGGVRGVVISLAQLNFMAATGSGAIHAEAGGRTIDLARLAEAYSLAGLEFLSGIPGTVGGAVRMNAGAHGGEIFDGLDSLDILEQGAIRHYRKNSLDYGYRHLQLDSHKIIIAATFQLTAGNREEIAAAMNDCLQKRRTTQRVRYPNAGSFFKNPHGHSAWRLIDEAGLRGLTIGGAQVSEVHANFLVNRGSATAADFITLAAVVRDRVYKRSSIILEEEVRIMGEA